MYKGSCQSNRVCDIPTGHQIQINCSRMYTYCTLSSKHRFVSNEEEQILLCKVGRILRVVKMGSGSRITKRNANFTFHVRGKSIFFFREMNAGFSCFTRERYGQNIMYIMFHEILFIALCIILK